VNKLMNTVANLKIGENHTFTVIRDGKEENFTVKIDMRKQEIAGENSKLWPGVYVHPADDDIRGLFKLKPGDSGLVAIRIIDKSPAALINLQRGDLISEVNGVPVKTMADFYKVLREKAKKELYFGIKRNGSQLETMMYKR